MAESKRTEAGGMQPASEAVGPAVQPPSAKCGSSCPGADAKAMPYAVPMVTGIGPVTDLTRGADVSEPMVYAVPMVSGLGPVIDLTQPQIVIPLADGGVSRVVDGAAFVDLTRAVEVVGGLERPPPALVEAAAGEMQTRDLIGPANYDPVPDTTLFPQSAVVQIHGYDAGTGIMIGPRRVLTCAHVVVDEWNKPVEDIYVVPALADAEMPFGDAWVQEVILDPRLDQLGALCQSLQENIPQLKPLDCSPFDFAVLILDRPLGKRTGHVGTSDIVDIKALEWGSCDAVYAIESYGYPGVDVCPKTPDCPRVVDLPNRQMYRVEGVTRPLGKNIPSPPPGFPGCTRFGHPEVLYHDIDVKKGQSGSSVLLKSGTQGKLGGHTSVGVVATMKGSTPQRLPPTEGRGVNWGPLITTRRQMFLARLASWDAQPPSPFAAENYDGWTPLGTRESLRPPAVVAYGTNRLDVVYTDTGGWLFWMRREKNQWSGPVSLDKVVTHAPSIAVRPSGPLHVAARLSDGRLLAGFLGSDQLWHWAPPLAAAALDAPTIVATDDSHVQLFYLSRDPSLPDAQDTPRRRTVGWYEGTFGGTTGTWEWRGFIGGGPSSSSRSIRSKIAAVAVNSGQVALAGVDSDGKAVFYAPLSVGPGSAGDAPWVSSARPPGTPANPLVGPPCLVVWRGSVHAIMRSEPFKGGEAYRARLPPPMVGDPWQRVDLPLPGVGEPSAVVDPGDELLIFGRVCANKSTTHGRIVGIATSSSGSVVRQYNARGTMIDVRAAMVRDRVWLVCRGQDLRLYQRIIDPFAATDVKL